MRIGSNSKDNGVNSKKKSRNWKKVQNWRVKGPNPRIWWIRIKLTLQERWIDPDPSGSWSTLRIEGTWTGSWVDPTQHTYKRGQTRIYSLLSFSSSSPLRRFPLFQTLNLISWNLPRICSSMASKLRMITLSTNHVRGGNINRSNDANLWI